MGSVPGPGFIQKTFSPNNQPKSEEISLEDYVVIEGLSSPKHSLSGVELAGISTDLAYGIGRAQFIAKDARINGVMLADTHWKPLHYSSDSYNTNQYGYKAVAMVNHQTQEVHIASAGTVIDCYDCLDDILLAWGTTPNKLQPLKFFVDRVIQTLGGEEAAARYQFSTSGHSLGAVVADLTAMEIVARRLPLSDSITFENPGSATAINYALNYQLLSRPIDGQQVEQLSARCTVYNAKPNLINCTQPQFAQRCYLVLPTTVQQRKKEVTADYCWGSYLRAKIGSAWSYCANYLGLDHLRQIRQEHGLNHFKQIERSQLFPVKQWSRWGEPLIIDGTHFSSDAHPGLSDPEGNGVIVECEQGSFVDIRTINYDDLPKIAARTCQQVGAMSLDCRQLGAGYQESSKDSQSIWARLSTLCAPVC